MMPKCEKYGRYLEYLCAGFFFCLIIGIVLMGKPLESLDELWQYSYGSNISKACLPYRDINMVTTPFSQYLCAAAISIFGEQLLVYRGLGTVLCTLCMLLFYDIVRIAGVEKRAAFCFSIYVCAFYSTNFTYDYNYLVLFFLLAIIDMMLRCEGQYHFWIGSLAGCAVMTKQSTGLVLLAAVTLLMTLLKECRGGKQWLLYGIGCLLPIGGGLTWIAANGIWDEFLDYTFGGLGGFAEQNRITAMDFFFRSGMICMLEGLLWLLILGTGLCKLTSIAVGGREGGQKDSNGWVKLRKSVLNDIWGQRGNKRWESRQKQCGQRKLKACLEPQEQMICEDVLEPQRQVICVDIQELQGEKFGRVGLDRRKWIIMLGLSLAGMAVAYPITDEVHFVIALFPFLIIGICELPLNKSSKAKLPVVVSILVAAMGLGIGVWQIRGEEAESGLKHLEGIRIDSEFAAQIEIVDAWMAHYAEGRSVYILDSAAVLFKIPLDLYDKDYDVCIAGNWGGKTAEELADDLLAMGGVMLLSAEGYNDNWQIPETFLEYIRERAVCVDRVGKYDVYMVQE